MKKILALVVLLSSLFALVACQSAVSNTKVRVVGLSYSSTETTLATTPSNNSMRLLSNKLLADEVEEYIFPGDILTFTVELEDPNFEFISLLSIKFNDQVIRANVDNSIVTTRDCGVNICVDFPFEVSIDVSEYSVQEVKFAKTNVDGGVSAIIDNDTINKVILSIYQDDIYPYVVSSVALLNEMISQMDFYSTSELKNIFSDFDTFQWVMVWYFENRVLFIENLNTGINQSNLYGINFGTIELKEGNDYGNDYNQYIQLITSNIFDSAQFGDTQPIFTKPGAPIYQLVPDIYTIFLGVYEDRYSDIYAHNIGNTVYLSINNVSYQLLVFDKLTRLVPIQFEIPLTYVD